MENTINTAVEAVEAANKMGFNIPENKNVVIAFGAGVVTTIVVEKVVVPTGKKVVDKIKAKTGKKKPLETTAEVVEIEE